MRTPSGRLAARQRLLSRRAFLERWPYRSSPVAEPWRDSVWDSPLRIRRCGLGDVYGTMMSGTGEWRARPTATEPTTRRVAWDELPTMIATFSSGWASPMAVALRLADRRWCPGAVRTPRPLRCRAAARRLGREDPSRSRRSLLPFRRRRRGTARRGWTGEPRTRCRCGRAGPAVAGPRRPARGWRAETRHTPHEVLEPRGRHSSGYGVGSCAFVVAGKR